MPCVNAHGETLVREAQALLAHIDQVARWLPAREPHRRNLLISVAEIEQQIAGETPLRGAILNLQIHAWGLRGSPLRTLLNRRVAELGELYGLQSR